MLGQNQNCHSYISHTKIGYLPVAARRAAARRRPALIIKAPGAVVPARCAVITTRLSFGAGLILVFVATLGPAALEAVVIWCPGTVTRTVFFLRLAVRRVLRTVGSVKTVGDTLKRSISKKSKIQFHLVNYRWILTGCSKEGDRQTKASILYQGPGRSNPLCHIMRGWK